MATLNQISNDIASTVGRRYDNEYIARVKNHILSQRALFYRRSIDRSGVDDSFQHKFICDLKSVSKLFSNIDFGGQPQILRTVNKVPIPLRYKTASPFIYVGSVDLKLSFLHSQGWELAFSEYLPLTNPHFVVRYSYINGYIYLDRATLENFLPKPISNSIAIIAVFENPFLAYNQEDNESGIHYEDDMEFPLSIELLNNIRTAIIKNVSEFDNPQQVIQPSIDNQ